VVESLYDEGERGFVCLFLAAPGLSFPCLSESFFKTKSESRGDRGRRNHMHGKEGIEGNDRKHVTVEQGIKQVRQNRCRTIALKLI